MSLMRLNHTLLNGIPSYSLPQFKKTETITRVGTGSDKNDRPTGPLLDQFEPREQSKQETFRFPESHRRYPFIRMSRPPTEKSDGLADMSKRP